jgi:hypothetical protein
MGSRAKGRVENSIWRWLHPEGARNAIQWQFLNLFHSSDSHRWADPKPVLPNVKKKETGATRDER